MRASSSQSAAALLAFTASLAVLSAGCLAQDRPHEDSFFVVADAGNGAVATEGDTLHFEWSEANAIEAEAGATVHEELEYSWLSSAQQLGNHSEFNLTTAAEGLVLVELNVTAKNHTASDAAALLVLPATAPLGGRLYVASLGDIHIEPESGSVSAPQSVHLGEFKGERSTYDLGGVQNHRFQITFPDVILEAQGTILLGVKSPSNATRSHASPALKFDPALKYTLIVDTSPAQAHRIETRNEALTLTNDSSLSDYEAANHAPAEVKVLVTPSRAKLPGFEGAAVASAVALASLVTLRRRR